MEGFISAFHGPWLQLPHEILETLAHSNFLSPRPRQTDPSVLYDLIKIRKLVDEASDLAVRAANGTASSALGGSDNGLPGGALGLSYRGAGGNAKLSPERKYRMRELAVHKLSQAYRLDEIATSVATMQGASALDQVATFVLQRNPNNVEAKYVHFFHEKIPSRMMSECTPLTVLNEIISSEPGLSAPYRTRALTRIFKEDYLGAAQDLTEALTLCRVEAAKHKAGRNQLVTMQTVREEAEKRKIWTKDWMQENKVLEEDQPRGIEMQILFQRGNQYLTIACRSIREALEGFRTAKRLRNESSNGHDDIANSSTQSTGEAEAYKTAIQAREMVRKYSKRALRDYTTFFSKLDYAHAPRHAANEEIFSRDPIVDDLDEFDPPSSRRAKEVNGITSTALTRRHNDEGRNTRYDSSPPPPLKIHEMSSLLSTSPPTNLPPFPSSTANEDYDDETLTYHPLLPETLHSFLLTHCLLQTDATTLLRHAHNVARLVRLADGYPFFLAARSPARADWAEILRKTHNWIGLSWSWETLCKSVPGTAFPREGETTRSNGQPESSSIAKLSPKQPLAHRTKGASEDIAPSRPRAESTDQKRDRIHKEAVMEALGDERVVDDETFHRAVQAREKRAWRDSIEEATKEANGEANGHETKQIEAATSTLVGDLPAPASASTPVPAAQSTAIATTNGTTSLIAEDAPAPAPVSPSVLDTPETQALQTPSLPPSTSISDTTPKAALTPKPDPASEPTTNAKINPKKPLNTTPDPHIPFKQPNKPVAKDEEYLIGTERAEAIALWVREAPMPSAVDTTGLVAKKKRTKGRRKVVRREEGIEGNEEGHCNGSVNGGEGNGNGDGNGDGDGDAVGGLEEVDE